MAESAMMAFMKFLPRNGGRHGTSTLLEAGSAPKTDPSEGGFTVKSGRRMRYFVLRFLVGSVPGGKDENFFHYILVD